MERQNALPRSADMEVGSCADDHRVCAFIIQLLLGGPNNGHGFWRLSPQKHDSVRVTSGFVPRTAYPIAKLRPGSASCPGVRSLASYHPVTRSITTGTGRHIVLH